MTLPPAAPPDLTGDGMLRVRAGAGPLFHRTYTARIRDSRWSAEALMWTSVHEKVSDPSHSRLERGIDIETRRVDAAGVELQQS
jgi:hypothetical protein